MDTPSLLPLHPTSSPLVLVEALRIQSEVSFMWLIRVCTSHLRSYKRGRRYWVRVSQPVPLSPFKHHNETKRPEPHHRLTASGRKRNLRCFWPGPPLVRFHPRPHAAVRLARGLLSTCGEAPDHRPPFSALVCQDSEVHVDYHPGPLCRFRPLFSLSMHTLRGSGRL